MAIAVAVLALAAIVVGMVAVNANNAKPKGAGFPGAVRRVLLALGRPLGEGGDDGSYLAIDASPGDNAASYYGYSYYAYDAIKGINKTLGFDESLLEEMNGTNSLMGARTETGNGVKATWNYHPDYGLEVTYSLDNE